MLARCPCDYVLIFIGAFDLNGLIHVYMPKNDFIGKIIKISASKDVYAQIISHSRLLFNLNKNLSNTFRVDLDIDPRFLKVIKSSELNSFVIANFKDLDIKLTEPIAMYACLYKKNKIKLDKGYFFSMPVALKSVRKSDYRKYYLQAFQVFMGGFDQSCRVISQEDL